MDPSPIFMYVCVCISYACIEVDEWMLTVNVVDVQGGQRYGALDRFDCRELIWKDMQVCA